MDEWTTDAGDLWPVWIGPASLRERVPQEPRVSIGARTSIASAVRVADSDGMRRWRRSDIRRRGRKWRRRYDRWRNAGGQLCIERIRGIHLRLHNAFAHHMI